MCRSDRVKKQDLGLLLRYCLLYLITLFVIMGGMMPILQNSYKSAEAKVIAEGREYLHNGISELENRISEIVSLAAAVQTNEYYVELKTVKGQPDTASYYSMRKLRDMLANMFAVNNDYANIFVVYNQNPIVVNRNVIEPTDEEKYGTILSFGGMNDFQWRKYIREQSNPISYLPQDDIYGVNGKICNGMACIVKMPIYSITYTDGAVIGVIDTEEITHMIMDSDSRETGFYRITDSNDNIIVSYGDADIPNGKLNTGELSTDTGKYYVLNGSFEYGNGLNVVMGIDQGLFSAKIEDLFLLQRMYFIVSITILALFCLGFALRQYIRIRRLRLMLPDVQRRVRFEGEYGAVMRVLNVMYEDRALTESNMKNMSCQLQSEITQKLFWRGLYTNDEKRLFEKLISANIDTYCVVKVNVKNVGDQSITRMFVELKEYLSKLSDEDTLVVQTDTFGMAALISCDCDDEKFVNSVIDSMMQMCKYIKTRYTCHLYVGVSSVLHGIEGVPDAYRQSSVMARLVAVEDEYGVKVYSEENTQRFLVDLNASRRMYDIILTGNTAGVDAMFNNIKDQILKNGISHDESMHNLFYSIKNGLMHAQRNLPNKEPIKLPHYDDQKQLDVMLEELRMAAEKICERYTNVSYDAKNKKSNAILQYIRENYNVPDINAATIAQECDMSEKYLYQLAKESTGKTLGEYIEQLRMDESVRLLRETQMSIGDIAQKAGYYSPNTFYKTFKRVYGVSPGKFRDLSGDG